MMFLERIAAFANISRISVAVPRQACRVLATLALVALAGCATSPGSLPASAPTTVEGRQALVTARANARWEAVIKGDLDASYLYLSPASRDVMSFERYKASIRRGAFRAVKVESVTCKEDVCEARLLVTYDHRLMKGIVTPIVEAWVLDGGQAWLVG